MRIHTIGGTGSGKTTLAKRLSRLLNIPFYEMDVVGWENGYGAERPLEVKLRDIHTIAIQPGWVTEGGHFGWVDELLQTADKIIYLDVPWRVACYRILTRHLCLSLAGTNRHRGLRKLYHFLGYARKYYTSTDPAKGHLYTLHMLQPYRYKVIHCRNSTDVEQFVTDLQNKRQKETFERL